MIYHTSKKLILFFRILIDNIVKTINQTIKQPNNLTMSSTVSTNELTNLVVVVGGDDQQDTPTTPPPQSTEEKPPKAPTLPAKFLRYKVFSYWLLNKMTEMELLPDFERQGGYDILKLFSTVEDQTALYTTFEDELFGEAKKAMAKEITQHNKPPKKKATKAPKEPKASVKASTKTPKPEVVTVVTTTDNEPDVESTPEVERRTPTPPPTPTSAVIVKPKSVRKQKVVAPPLPLSVVVPEPVVTEEDQPPIKKVTKKNAKPTTATAPTPAVVETDILPPIQQATEADKKKTKKTKTPAPAPPTEEAPATPSEPTTTTTDNTLPQIEQLPQPKLKRGSNRPKTPKTPPPQPQSLTEDIQCKTAIVDGIEIYYDKEHVAYDRNSIIIGSYDPVRNVVVPVDAV
jgi:hypothetical protein